MEDIVQATARIVTQQPIDSIIQDDLQSNQEKLNCRKKALVFILQSLTILLM